MLSKLSAKRISSKDTKGSDRNINESTDTQADSVVFVRGYLLHLLFSSIKRADLFMNLLLRCCSQLFLGSVISNKQCTDTNKDSTK